MTDATILSLMRRGFLALVVVALAAATPAQAKQFTKLVLVGDRGTSLEIRDPSLWRSGLDAPPSEAPAGSTYLLVYPIFDKTAAGLPGRYYPIQHTMCLSLDRATLGGCRPVSDALAAKLALASALPRFARDPTVVTRLSIAGHDRGADGNDAIGVELAFNRSRLAHRARRPAQCAAVVASWGGPDAATRPTRFCLAPRGIWARGRLYPSGLWELDGLP